ncbi:hypothetical protein RQP46_005950 [Phenoliferia psychrophenolica]
MLVTPNQRAITLIFACITALSAGTNYAYSSYGPQLAAQLGLSSTETNLIGAAGNGGVYLSGPLVGILVDRRGPRIPLLLGAVLLFLGYTILRTIYNGGEDGSFRTWGVGGLAFGEVLVGIGSSASLTAALNGTAKSFTAKRRGSAVASVVSCFGLSAFFYSTISHAVHGENATSTFLLILSLGCGGSTVVGSYFVRPALHAPVVQGYETIGAEDEIFDVPSSVGLPILSPEADIRRELGEDDDDDPQARAVKESQRSAELDISGITLLTSGDFWLLFSIIGLLSGIGLMYINNVGTVTRTLSPLDADPRKVAAAQAHLVSLLSVFNCLGRLTAGFVSDYFLHSSPLHLRFARVWWLVSAMFVLSQLLASWTTEVEGWFGLILPTSSTGFSYGFMFGILPILCIEWFGIISFSSNSGWVTIAPAVFGNSANILFGRIYDSNVVKRAPESLVPRAAFVLGRAGTTATDKLCLLGAECFATAFHMTTVMALLALALSCYAGMRKGRLRR